MLLPVAQALPFFSDTHTAYDVTTTYDANDRAQEVRGANYTVYGSFQPAGPKELAILPEGDVSKGVCVFLTQNTLSFHDTTEQGGALGVQSFIVQDSDTWRVKALGAWNRYTTHRRYLCVKFLELGGV